MQAVRPAHRSPLAGVPFCVSLARRAALGLSAFRLLACGLCAVGIFPAVAFGAAADLPKEVPGRDLFAPLTDDELELSSELPKVEPVVRKTEPAERPWTEKELRRMTAGLGDDHFGARRAAQRELATLPRSSLTTLAGLFHETQDVETRSRIKRFACEFFRDYLLEEYDYDNRRAFLGIAPTEGASSTGVPCVMVAYIIEGSTAEKIGLRTEDRILTVDGKAPDPQFVVGSFAQNIAAHRIGSIVTLLVERGENRFTLKAALGAMPLSEEEAQALQDRITAMVEIWWRDAFLQRRLIAPTLPLKSAAR